MRYNVVNTLINLNRRSLAYALALPAGIFLLAQLTYAAALTLFAQNDLFLGLSAVLPLITALEILSGGTIQCWHMYELAVRMGRTRRETLRALLICILLEGGILMAFSELLVQLDTLIIYGLWARALPHLSIYGGTQLIPIWAVGLTAALLPLAIFILTALLRRWGPGILGLIWCCWMLYMCSNIGRQLLSCTSVHYYLLPIISLILLVWSIHYLRHANI